MKIKEIILKNSMAIVAALIVTTFFAFKVSESRSGKKFASVTIYFHGNPDVSGQVSNESNWNTTSNGQSCSGTAKACSMVVDASDLTASGQLDPTKIDLGESYSGNGYTPTQIGGDSETEISPQNRN